MNINENEIDTDDILYEMHDLLDENKFDEIIALIKIHNVTINLLNFNNDESLIQHACETLNFEGIKFCVKNNVSITALSKACCYTFNKMNNNNYKLITEIIDYVIENNAHIIDLYHYSLTWNNWTIHLYLLEKYMDKIDLNWITSTIKICVTFGNYEIIKNCFTSTYYKDIITDKIINSCLDTATYNSNIFTKNDYDFINYLITEKNATLDNKIKMNKLIVFMEEYPYKNTYEQYIFLRKIFDK